MASRYDNVGHCSKDYQDLTFCSVQNMSPVIALFHFLDITSSSVCITNYGSYLHIAIKYKTIPVHLPHPSACVLNKLWLVENRKS